MLSRPKYFSVRPNSHPSDLQVVDEHVRIVGLLDMMTCVEHAIDRLKKNAQEIQQIAGFGMKKSIYEYIKSSFQVR